MRWGKTTSVALVALVLAGCPGDPPADPEDGSSGSGLTNNTSTENPPPTDGDGTDTDVVTGGNTQDGTADGSGTTEGPPGETDNPTSGGTGPGIPVDCPSQPGVLECGDGIDNDGDGFIDLMDPECVSPCDDDESSFQTGLPGDNVDCRQDCFFDGNSGHGDDGCEWDLRCDPANPGAGLMPDCSYNPDAGFCDNLPPEAPPECLEACIPLVPPGCDCYGCCEVYTPDGPVYIYINSPPPCSLDDLGACNECTQQEDCIVPCMPEECQVCFGQTDVPEGCDDNTCPNDGTVCDSTADCPTDWFCYLECCYPPPPG